MADYAMRAAALALTFLMSSCQRSPAGDVAPEVATRAPTPPPRAKAAPSALVEQDRPKTVMSAQRRTALRQQLRLTEGRFLDDSSFAVRASKLRAVQTDSAGDRASLRFRYEGTSSERSELKSGAVREQLGLKLRARDSCNLVYIMWRFQPEARLVVSVKENASEATHAECENRGYTNLRPREQRAPAPVAAGAEYELTARIEGDTLSAWINGQLVWRGQLPASALQLSGPAGFRSDNVQWTLLDFDASAPQGPSAVGKSDPTGSEVR
jgi:hypothetical protein